MNAKLSLAVLGIFAISAGAVAWSKFNNHDAAQSEDTVVQQSTDTSLAIPATTKDGPSDDAAAGPSSIDQAEPVEAPASKQSVEITTVEDEKNTVVAAVSPETTHPPISESQHGSEGQSEAEATEITLIDSTQQQAELIKSSNSETDQLAETVSGSNEVEPTSELNSSNQIVLDDKEESNKPVHAATEVDEEVSIDQNEDTLAVVLQETKAPVTKPIDSTDEHPKSEAQEEVSEVVLAGVEVVESADKTDLDAQVDEAKQASQPNSSGSVTGDYHANIDDSDLDALKQEIERLKAELEAARSMTAEQALAAAKTDTPESTEATNASVSASTTVDPLAALSGAALPLTLTEVHFDTGQSAMTPGGFRKTKDVFGLLDRLNNPVIRIEGYSDTTGPSDLNQTLSQDRAEAVRSMLVELGYDPSKVEIQAMGETNLPEPTADGVSEPLNRCVGIVLVGYESG